MQSSILPILVLYKMGLGDSPTYQTFRESAQRAGCDARVITVYDNSKGRQVSLTEEVRLLAYKHDPENSGLAAAYNWGLDIARQRGFSWVLLLDQDTKLPVTFLPSLVDAVLQHNLDDTVAAIVPFTTDNGVPISPKRIRIGRRTSLTSPIPKIAEYEVTAINSGAALRVPFLMSIGGFNTNYRLDCLDHWFFRQVSANGMRVALSGETVEHDLSVSDYRNQVSPERYRSILSAEAMFITTEKPWIETPIYIARLILRTMKQRFVYRRPELASQSCAMALAMMAPGLSTLLKSNKQRHASQKPQDQTLGGAR